MDLLILGNAAVPYALRAENTSDALTASPCAAMEQALRILSERAVDAIILLPCAESDALTTHLTTHPPLIAPYIFGGIDGGVPEPERVPDMIRTLRQAGQLPTLTQHWMPSAERMANALLRQFGAPERLKAARFLPLMLSMTALHPAYTTNLLHILYPIIARHEHITAAAVERRLRLWIESAWSRGSMASLERFFGATIDPERGKPTNREFLCGASRWIQTALRRLSSPQSD